VVTLVPFLVLLTFLAVGLAPFVGPFALVVLLAALAVWAVWKVAADLLALQGENVFRQAETAELLGRGGPDDPEFILVHRRPNAAEEKSPTDEDAAASGSPVDPTGRRGSTEGSS
jgi:hypothetical protein